MNLKQSTIAYTVAGSLLGAASIVNVSLRAAIRPVDIAELFLGGMIAGALMTSAIIQWRHGSDRV